MWLRTARLNLRTPGFLGGAIFLCSIVWIGLGHAVADLQQVVLLPQIDGQVDSFDGDDNFTDVVNTTNTGITLFADDNQPVERRGLVEFDISAIPDARPILSATLAVDIAPINSAGVVDVHRYLGDGVITGSEANRLGALVDSFEVNAFTTYTMDIDPAAIEIVTGSNFTIGFQFVDDGELNSTRRLTSQELGFINPNTSAPTLTIVYDDGVVLPAPPDFGALMTTGSDAVLATTVDVPAGPFTLSFDYAFSGETGVLSVLLGGVPVTTLDSGQGVESVHLDGGAGALGETLDFVLSGPTGASVFLDNIDFPGLINGNFFTGDLTNWTSDGPGSVEVTQVIPEPSTCALLLTACLMFGRWPYRGHFRNPQWSWSPS